MAWSMTLSKTGMIDGDGLLICTFSDGTVKFDETVRVRGNQGSTYLEDYARDRIKQLTATDTWVKSLTPGTIAPSSDPVKSPGPTQADLDRAAWVTKYRQLLAWKRAVSVGVESELDAAYLALQADVNATKRPEYQAFY